MAEGSSKLAPRVSHPARWYLVPVLTGALVAIVLGLLARVEAIAPGTYPGGCFRLFFSDTLHLKAWFATAALALAVTQLLSAAWMFGKLPWRRPAWIGVLHRWTGRLVLVLTLPIAYHCIFRIGLQATSGRVLAHSFLGCAFYGAFAAKILVVRLRRFPDSALATAGGLLFALLLAVWYVSALWLFRSTGVRL